MNDVGVVQEIHCPADLVDDVLFVLSLQDAAFTNQRMQVHFHVLEHQIDVHIVVRLNDSLELYYIRVLELPKEHYLSINSLGVCRVREGIEVFLEGLQALCFPVLDLPDMAVCATANLFYDPVLGEDVAIDLLTHQR